MDDAKRIKRLTVVPALREEPPAMFEEGVAIPDERSALQQLFKSAVAGTAIAHLDFIPGSEVLLSLEDLMGCLEDVAQMVSPDVSSYGAGGELEGGYAFLDEGIYLFGAEPGSNIRGTICWDEMLEDLSREGRATNYYAGESSVEAEVRGDQVILNLPRSELKFIVTLQTLRQEIQRADNRLKDFATEFTPIHGKYLSQKNPSLKDPKRVAEMNFSNRPNWV